MRCCVSLFECFSCSLLLLLINETLRVSNGCHEVVLLEVGGCHMSNFPLILGFLVIFPSILSVAFLLGQSFIFKLHLLHHVLTLHCHLILQHSSHSVEVLRLLSVCPTHILAQLKSHTAPQTSPNSKCFFSLSFALQPIPFASQPSTSFSRGILQDSVSH